MRLAHVAGGAAATAATCFDDCCEMMDFDEDFTAEDFPRNDWLDN